MEVAATVYERNDRGKQTETQKLRAIDSLKPNANKSQEQSNLTTTA